MKKLCSGVTILLMLLSTVTVRAAPMEKTTFKQKVFFTNTTNEDITPQMDSYKFSIQEVEEKDLVRLREDAPLYKGDLKNVTLLTTEIAFDSVIVPANTEDFEFTSDIDLDFKDFEEVGDYRYILSNDTLNEKAYFDVRVVREEGEIKVNSCVFYSNTTFETKTDGFVASYLLENEDPIELVYKVIFRFEDPSGKNLTDDILFSRTEFVTGPVKPEPVKLAHGPMVLGARRAFTETDALNMYQSVLKDFLGRGYTLIKDEVADHTGNSWYSDDPNITMVYHIVMKAPEPTPTVTPVPSETPTPKPPPLITKTGELIAKYYYIGLIFVGIGCAIGILLAAERIGKSGKKDDSDDENGKEN